MSFRNLSLCLCMTAAFTACGVSGDKIFSANAQSDLIQVNYEESSSMVLDPLGNDGGSGKIIEDVTQGYYGTVTINSDGLDVTYTPNDVSEGTFMTDWFEYRVRVNNYSYDVGRVAVRFAAFDSDRYEPDDFQEYAQYLELRYGIPVLQKHTSDITNQVGNGTDPFAGSGQTIGGDEDWFQLVVPAAPDAGKVPWLRIETMLPNAPVAEHNALVITVMDQWGFLTNDLLGNRMIETAGSGGFDASGNNDGTELDRGINPGTYLVRISPEYGHYGKYDVRFTLYENAHPVTAIPVSVGKR